MPKIKNLLRRLHSTHFQGPNAEKITSLSVLDAEIPRPEDSQKSKNRVLRKRGKTKSAQFIRNKSMICRYLNWQTTSMHQVHSPPASYHSDGASAALAAHFHSRHAYKQILLLDGGLSQPFSWHWGGQDSCSVPSIC